MLSNNGNNKNLIKKTEPPTNNYNTVDYETMEGTIMRYFLKFNDLTKLNSHVSIGCMAVEGNTVQSPCV